MNSVEDLVRSAARAEAARMREVRPLRLPSAEDDVLEVGPPAAKGRRARRLRVRDPRSFSRPGWLAPAAAAAAVIALAVSLVIVKGLSNGSVVPADGPPALAGVPPYYVALSPGSGWYAYAPLTGQANPSLDDLVVGGTFTGKKLATVAPPDGATFKAVFAAGDDRTFAAESVPIGRASPDATWYRLLIAPGSSSPARLTRTPVPAIPARQIRAAAFSASGRELAVVVQLNPDKTADAATSVLRVYSVTTGKLLDSWSARGQAVISGSPTDQAGAASQSLAADPTFSTGLSWADGDRVIAFTDSWSVLKPNPAGDSWSTSMRTIDVPAESETETDSAGAGVVGGALISGSRLIWSTRTDDLDNGPVRGCPWVSGTWLTTNGNAVLCEAMGDFTLLSGDRARWTAEVVVDPTTAPAAGQIRDRAAVVAGLPNEGGVGVPWASASGTSMIIDFGGPVSATSPKYLHFGVVSNGRFTALPSPPGGTAPIASNIAW